MMSQMSTAGSNIRQNLKDNLNLCLWINQYRIVVFILPRNIDPYLS